MTDEEVLAHINALAGREHELRQREANGPLGDDDEAELRQAERALDQCWDLLRQRRAREEFGQDPDTAAVRDPETVRKYRQ